MFPLKDLVIAALKNQLIPVGQALLIAVLLFIGLGFQALPSGPTVAEQIDLTCDSVATRSTSSTDFRPETKARIREVCVRVLSESRGVK